uniref:COMM domain-containing protein 10 isoform 4 n=1 Tax=Rattus norvegicus TaxID=10116 RepID=UPI0030829609
MAASAALILPQSPSMKKAVPLINAIDTGRFPRLLSRILQKLHLKAVYHNVKPAVLQQQLETIHLTQDKAEAFANAWSTMGHETVEKFRQRILGPLKNLEKVLVEFNHKELFDFYNKLETIQAQLDSLT